MCGNRDSYNLALEKKASVYS